MRRTFLTIAISFLSLVLHAGTRDTLSILAIGNSFSEDAVEQNLSEIARSDGRCAIIGNLYIGGCPLDRHWRNVEGDKAAYRYRTIDADGRLTTFPDHRISEALGSRRWDVVTLQQSSPLSGKLETYEPYMASLIAYIRSVQGEDVKIMFHQTWSYTENATHPSFPDYESDQMLMYDSIMVASAKICERYALDVIPSGTAIQNARKTWLKDLLNRDGYHLTYACGRYTVACTWYEAIFGRPATGVSYIPPHVSSEAAAVCREAASAAVREPFSVADNDFCAPVDESMPTAFLSGNQTVSRLPEALVTFGGKKVRTASRWEKERRPELLQCFENQVYGKAPDGVAYQSFEVLEVKNLALGGLADRKRVRIHLDKKDKVVLDLLVYTPSSASGPVPLFLAMNYHGNAAVSPEGDIPLPSAADLKRYGEYVAVPHGSDAGSLPLEEILRAGYGVATFFYADADPGFDDSFVRGVRSLYPNDLGKICGPDQWGTIAARAWACSRVMDYLETDRDVSGVALAGSGELAKSMLWAAASDRRFAMVAAVASGCGGASLSRRYGGWDVRLDNRLHPNWFCDNFKNYLDDVETLPVDQHEMLALIAPRPLVLIGIYPSSQSDCYGELEAFRAAAPVYRLYRSLDCMEWNKRQGQDKMMPEDWKSILRHADKYFK